MNILIAGLLITTLLSNHRSVRDENMVPGDTTALRQHIELPPIGKAPNKPGLSIDPDMPVTKLTSNSKTPVLRLDVNSKMPIAKLEQYIAPAQPSLIFPKRDSTGRNFKWRQP